MKRLFYALFLMISLSFMSCSDDVKKTVENPKEYTTIAMQELQKDTMVVSIDEDKLYVFNESNEVMYQVNTIDFGDTASLVLLLIVVAFLFGLGVGYLNT